MCAHYETPEQIEKSRIWDYLPPNPLAFGAPVKKDAFPTDRGPFVKIQQDSGELTWAQGRFGLVPHWTRLDDLKKAGRGTYNARTETVHEKPSFRTAWKFRNWCIIPAAAIYEPSYETGRPVPWRIATTGPKLADGVGTAVAERLFADPAVTKIQTDPAPNNHRAIRCYEKAGFVQEKIITTPDGPAVYMILTRQALERGMVPRRNNS